MGDLESCDEVWIASQVTEAKRLVARSMSQDEPTAKERNPARYLTLGAQASFSTVKSYIQWKEDRSRVTENLIRLA